MRSFLNHFFQGLGLSLLHSSSLLKTAENWSALLWIRHLLRIAGCIAHQFLRFIEMMSVSHFSDLDFQIRWMQQFQNRSGGHKSPSLLLKGAQTIWYTIQGPPVDQKLCQGQDASGSLAETWKTRPCRCNEMMSVSHFSDLDSHTRWKHHFWNRTGYNNLPSLLLVDVNSIWYSMQGPPVHKKLHQNQDASESL